MYINDYISFSSSYNEKRLRQRRKRKSKHILCSIKFSENRAVYGVAWKNIVELNRPYMTIRRMRIACRITKSTNTLSEYAISIAFLRCSSGCTKVPQCTAPRLVYHRIKCLKLPFSVTITPLPHYISTHSPVTSDTFLI